VCRPSVLTSGRLKDTDARCVSPFTMICPEIEIVELLFHTVLYLHAPFVPHRVKSVTAASREPAKRWVLAVYASCDSGCLYIATALYCLLDC